MPYNIYCDESCHLENDNADIMILGAVTCTESEKAVIYNEIRAIKKKNGLDSHFEIKWTKVSESKVEFFPYVFYQSNTHAKHNHVKLPLPIDEMLLHVLNLHDIPQL